MNLHSLVRGAVNLVTPDVSATMKRSTGYTTDASGKRVPAYQTIANVMVQVQGSKDAPVLAQINALNLQGVLNVVYLPGNWQGVVRGDKQGGDHLQFPLTPGGEVKDWLIVHILESWPDWTLVIAQLQN